MTCEGSQAIRGRLLQVPLAHATFGLRLFTGQRGESLRILCERDQPQEGIHSVMRTAKSQGHFRDDHGFNCCPHEASSVSTFESIVNSPPILRGVRDGGIPPPPLVEFPPILSFRLLER